MSDSPRILGVIPARGGSKGLPRKNVRPLAGKPLVRWTIDAALEARSLSRIVLSSEDPEIIELAQAAGCDVPFVRPAELARDETPGIHPLLHAIDACERDEGLTYDWVVMLQPTSPLRTSEDIDGTVALCVKGGAPACVSVVEVSKPPEWMYRLSDEAKLDPVLKGEIPHQRQAAPVAYALNGAVYCAQTEFVRFHRTFVAPGTRGYVMPAERSADVDNDLDLAWCEFLLMR